MVSSDEMYRQGVRDAEHDDLNLFYYQHYYYYRKGYDHARRSRLVSSGIGRHYLQRALLVIGIVAIVGMLVSIGMPYFRSEGSSSPAEGAATVTDEPRTEPEPTATPVPPTPTPTPTPTPDPNTLHAGGMAEVVNVGSSVLRARAQPGTTHPVQVGFPQGAQVQVLDGPVDADGYVWWHIEGERGSGWSAEADQEGKVWLRPVVGEP
jgi:hypothetical protein